MILSSHLITGAALGANFQNIYLMPIAAMALHFFLDKIPHYDYKIKPFSLVVIAKVTADISFGIITILIIYLFFNPSINLTHTAIGMFFSALPDGFLLASFIFKNKWLQKYQKLHVFFHKNNEGVPKINEKNEKTPIRADSRAISVVEQSKNNKLFKIGVGAGLLTQIIVTAVAIYFLI